MFFDPLRELRGDGVQHLPRRRARRLRVRRPEYRQRRVPPRRQPARDPALQLGALIGMRRAVRIPLLLPLGFQPGASGLGAPPLLERLLRHIEWLERRPAEVLLRRLHFVDAQRRAVRLGGVLLVRTSPRDVRPHDDERRAVADTLRLRDCLIDRVQIVAVGDPLHVPAVGLEALDGVVGESQIGGAVDRDAIVVVKADQLAQLQVSRERARLVRDALHQIAIGREEVGVVIDDRLAGPIEQGRELRFGDRHADGIPGTLTERSRRGFDTGCDAVLRMSRGAAAPLPELFDVVEGEVVSGEVEDAVEQHAGVARREHEAIAVQPLGIRGVVPEMALPQHIGERRQRHRRARMARLRLLHGVHRQRADRVDAELVEADRLGQSRPDLAACHSFVSRSKPSTSMSTCCGDGDAWAATFSSSTSFGISRRPCFVLSIPIRVRSSRIL